MPLPEEGLTVQAGKFFEEYSELRAVSESFTVVGKKHFEVNRQNNNQLLKAVFHTGQAIDEDISPGSPYGLYAVGVSMHNSHNAAISTVVTNFNYLFQLASESGLNRSIVLPNNNKQINVIDEEYVEFENTSKRKGAGGYISADLKEGFSFYSDFFLQGRFYLEPENRRQPIAFELGIRPEYTRYTQLSVVIGDGTFDAHTIRFNREPAPEGRVKNCPYGVGYGPDSNWFEVRVDRDEVNPVKSICTLFLARSEQELLARVKQNKFAHARTFETMEVANPEHRSTKDSILVRLAARARGTVRLHHLTIGESYDHSSRNLKEIKEVLARQMGLTPKSL